MADQEPMVDRGARHLVPLGRASIEREGPPLAGVVHAADVVDDADAPPPLFEDSNAEDDLPALGRDEVLIRRLEASAPKKRTGVAATAIRRILAEVMKLDDAAQLDPQMGLFELGLDSLTLLELMNRLQDVVGQPLSPIVAFSYPTVHELAGHLVRDLLGLDTCEATAADAPETRDELDTMLDEIDQLSDEDAEALLADLSAEET